MTNAAVATYVVGDGGRIDANRSLALADGALWIPLFDDGTVLKVGIPI